MRNEKYIVFKRDEWDAAPHRIDVSEPKEIEDAVVIRRQDAFAPPALDAYANAITVALELMTYAITQCEQSEQLKDIADYFHQQAKMSWEANRKIPD